jgi:hypothetical protein
LTGSARGILIAFGLLVAVTGCADPRPTSTAPASASPSVDATDSEPSNIASSSPIEPSEPPHAASFAPTGVQPDPSLLDLVPATEAHATLTYDPQVTADVAADPDLVGNISYLAIGLGRPVGADVNDPNFAIVNVARPRDENAVNDAWFRDWRDSYDEPACAQAGGVARHSQTEIAGVTVFTAACTNGAFTYHALIADRGIVLSITSVGPANLGRTIVEHLHR